MATGEKRKLCRNFGAVMTAVMVLLVAVILLLPVKKAAAVTNASSYGITIETTPSTIEEGSSFSMYIRFPETVADRPVEEGYTISLNGVNGLSGTASAKTELVKDGNSTTFVYIPAGSFTYDGKNAPGLEIKIPGDSTVYTGGFSYRVTPPEVSEVESSEPALPELIGNQITVSESASMPEIEASETKSILIPLTAKSVVGTAQVTLSMPDGLYLNSAAATQSVKFGKSKSEALIAEVTAKKDVTDAVVPIEITSVYEYDGKQVTETTTFSVRLKAAQQIESTGKLVITGYELGSSSLSYNGNTSLTVTVQNKGTAAMKEITMTLDGLSTGGIALKSGMDVQTLAELLPGQTSTFTYQLHADENVADGTAILSATAACGEETSTVKVFVPCIAKPEEQPGGETSQGPGSSKPQVIIESYDYGGENVVGGSTFNLSMLLRNTSSTTAIENIKMVISSAADDTGGVFTPASSSNSFYIARVGAGESFSENIDLTVKADASPKSYGIDIELSYEAVIDNVRQELTATERITIPVTQPDRFEVEEASISDYNYVGDSIWCSLSYVNKGKSAIYNLSIAIEGEGFTTADSTTYIGNVEAGSGDYFETTLNATQAGRLEGKFILTYEDATGTQSTIERPFATNVQEIDWGGDDEMDDPGLYVDEETTSVPLWVKIAIGAGCAVLIVGILLLARRLHQKKRQAAFDDEDDDDYEVDSEDEDDE
jgi:hypothetical protein